MRPLAFRRSPIAPARAARSTVAARVAMLALEQVRKSYVEPGGQPLPILDIQRFVIAPGEQVVLRGRSGCGKTTLLNCIAGLTTIDHGAIEVNGRDISRMPEAMRDRYRATFMGFVFQTFNLLPAFTALENVMLGMTFTGSRPDAQRARQLLAQVGLENRLAYKPSALSVGQQQRVAVARALANRPVLLLADEPTANIDPAHQQQVIDLLRDACRRENIAMLLVTHSPEVAGQFDRVEQLEDVNRVASPS